MTPEVRASPRADAYDVVVIGSGLGGLTAGALLAKAGRAVLVVEQGEVPGGYAAAVTRGPYKFDPAVHRMPQAHEGGLPDAILRFLGVRDQVEFKLLSSHYEAILPDVRMRVPFGFDQFVEAHCEAWPQDAEGIRRLYEVCRTLHRENHNLPPRLGLAELDEAARKFPTVFKYVRATVSEVLDEFLDDSQAKAGCAAAWPHHGSPPSRLSFVTYALASVMESEGSYFCVGGFQSLVDALVAALELHGGELVLGTGAERILVDNDRVSGVALEGGDNVRAQAVVSNADARHTFEDLLGEEHVPRRFIKKLRRMEPSPSAVVITAATSLDTSEAGMASEVFKPLHEDIDREWANISEGRPGGLWAAFPSLEDASLAPPGEHIVVLSSIARHEVGRPWKELREPFAEQLIDEFEEVLPGLRESITFMEVATPDTLQRYTRNSEGAIYGWENTPGQSGGRRTANSPPVEGLVLAGHWTQPGSSSLRVTVSGLNAADMTMEANGWGPLGFAHTDRPPV